MLLFLYGLTRKSINLILFLLSILLNAPVKVLSLETALEYKLYISKDQYGFHRSLCYHVYIQNVTGGSSILIEETLPRDMFVDPYQTEEDDRILMKESVDCEIPAYLASDLKVRLCSSSELNSHQICVPVHFRYQYPHRCQENGMSAEVQMNKRLVFIKNIKDFSERLPDECLSSIDWNSQSLNKNPEVQLLNFQIPVGCIEHFYPVLLSTTLTVSLSIVYFLSILKVDKLQDLKS